MSREGVEFGAHTKTHPILSCIQPEEQREEIEGSKRRLEEELGRSVVHFCYPNGRRSDFNDVTLRLLTEFDFRSATTAEPGMNQRRADPLALRRLGAGPVLTREYFRELLAGVRSD